MVPINAVDYLFEMDGVPNTVMVGVTDDYTPIVRFCKSGQFEERLDNLVEGDSGELDEMIAHETFETDGRYLMVEVRVTGEEIEFDKIPVNEGKADDGMQQVIENYYNKIDIDSSNMVSLVDAISDGTPLVIIIDCETGDFASTFDAF